MKVGLFYKLQFPKPYRRRNRCMHRQRSAAQCLARATQTPGNSPAATQSTDGIGTITRAAP